MFSGLTMLEKFIEILRSDSPNLPNSLTRPVGELVRNARLESNMSQSQLARKTYLKQSSISRIEDGMRAISMEDLLYLSIALNKPISYFFPVRKLWEVEGIDKLSPLEKELIMQIRKLESDDDLRKLIAQVRGLNSLADYDFGMDTDTE